MNFREYLIFVLVALHAPSYARYLLVDLETEGGENSQKHVDVDRVQEVTEEPSFDPAIRHVVKFNEACCEEEGVPEDCMGQCRENAKGRSFSVQFPTTRCAQHQETIKACMTVERIMPPTTTGTPIILPLMTSKEPAARGELKTETTYFNQTCCKDVGVPKQCMGACISPRVLKSDFLRNGNNPDYAESGYRNLCVGVEPLIAKCVVHVSTGKRHGLEKTLRSRNPYNQEGIKIL